LFIDIYNYLNDRGYHLFNLSQFRMSRRVLPMPLLWDHRDHHGQPMIVGHTTRGQLVVGDAFFARDLIADDFIITAGDRRALLRVLKAAAVFELYNAPDCAAELLLQYRDKLSDWLDVAEYLNQLVPENADVLGPRTYADYLDIYLARRGRLVRTASTTAGPQLSTETNTDLTAAMVAVDLTGGRAIASADDAGDPIRAFEDGSGSFWVSSERGRDVKGRAWLGYAFSQPRQIRHILLVQANDRHFRQDWVKVQASRDGGLIWDDLRPQPFGLRNRDLALIAVPDQPAARLWRVLAAGDNATEPGHAWSVHSLRFFGDADVADGNELVPVASDAGIPIASGDGLGSPERAFNGTSDTFWISAERGGAVKGQAWIGLALTEPRSIRQIHIAQPTNAAFRQDLVLVEKSTNGGLSWRSAALGPFRLYGSSSEIDLPDGERARLWRIVAAGNNAIADTDAWTVESLIFYVAADEPDGNELVPVASDAGIPIASGDCLGSPDRAFNGTADTFWISAERGGAVKGHAWIGCAFAAPVDIRQIRLTQTTNHPFRQDVVRIEKSQDAGVTWAPAASTPFKVIGGVSEIDLPGGEPAQCWRVVAAGDNATTSDHAWSVIGLQFYMFLQR
jgi:hypothetical protein